MNEIVASAGPALARGLIADIVGHGGGARREYRDIGAARALQLQLRILQAVANLIVGDFFLRIERHIEAGFQARDLRIAKLLQLARSRRVVTVAVDDHAQYIRVGLSTRMRCRSAGSGQIFANRFTNSPSFGMSLVILGCGQSVPHRIRLASSAMRAWAKGTASRKGRLPLDTRSEPHTLIQANGLF